MTERKRVIVGIDPGSTSAVAVLDLRGKLLNLYSEKHMSKEDIIRKVSGEGNPVLISTDKGKMPSTVEEITNSFGAKGFTPEEDLSVNSKKELTGKYDYEDLHERDALASALKAYNSYKDKFKNIEARMDDLNIQDLTPQVKESVVKGDAKNVSEAVEMALGEEEEEGDEEEDVETTRNENVEEKLDNYRQIIMKERKDKKKVKEQNERLKSKIEGLEEDKKELEEEVESLEQGKKKEVMKKREVKRLKRNVRSKENRIKDLEAEKSKLEKKVKHFRLLNKLRKEGKIPIRSLGKLSQRTLKKEHGNQTLEGSVIFVEEIEGDEEELLQGLKKMDVGSVIGDLEESFIDRLISEGIWSCRGEDLEINEEQGVKYINNEAVEKIKTEGKKSFRGWLKRYRDRDE
ncbi:MAG: DUF460 domain-containing protein [Candidatus Aenigmatarchaeota archaeon]